MAKQDLIFSDIIYANFQSADINPPGMGKNRFWDFIHSSFPPKRRSKDINKNSKMSSKNIKTPHR